jgi:nucleotide-binding universal stress UspA family protein
MIKDILVHLDASEAGARRLDLALQLAALVNGRLTGVHVTPPTELAPLYKPSQVAGALALAREGAFEDAGEAERIFQIHTRHSDSASEWRALTGNMVDVLAQEARVCDLALLGQYEWEGPATHHPLSLAEALVGHCGRPLLVVPGPWEPRIPKTALVAWDGSREAVRALHDALPLILAANLAVEIAWFREHHEIEDLQRVRRHLDRHGVSVTDLLALDTPGASTTRLLERLGEGHFELLIMGGFGHPAWFEFLFGGTTAAAMLKSQVPILISH